MAIVNLYGCTDLFERTDTLKRYYEDIRRFKPLSREEERKYFYIYQNGSSYEKEKAKEIIVNCNQRFVLAVAKRFATNDNILDLIEEGNIGLLLAIENFNVDTGNKFISHAVWYIRREINKYLINHNTVIRKSNASKTHHIISQATNKFIQQNHRQPTSEELLQFIDDNYNIKLNNEYDVMDVKYVAIDMNFDSEDELHGDQSYLYNQHTAEYQTFEKNIESEHIKTILELLMNKLTENERNVLKMTFGIGYDKTYELKEIADIIDYTPERVRQLRNLAIEKLKKEYKIYLNKK